VGGIESAFTFVDRRSLLHLWSKPSGAWLAFRIISKAGLFFYVTFVVAKLGAKVPWREALLVYALVFLVGLFVLAIEAGARKARLLLEDACTIAGLAVGVGFPVYVCIVATEHLLGIGMDRTIMDAGVSFIVLTASVCATLTLAAIFFTTTSLAGLLRGASHKNTTKYVLATVLTYFPRFEQDLRIAHLAFRSLEHVETARWTLEIAWSRLRRRCERLFLLLLAQIWKILVVVAPNCYLAVTERMRETEGD
jgi:hypothetical protein